MKQYTAVTMQPDESFEDPLIVKVEETVTSNNHPVKFYESLCIKYFGTWCCGLGVLLLVFFGLAILVSPLGLLCAALAPGVLILLLTRHYYSEQVTQGQMIVSFFECILWMIPLLAWDMTWQFAIVHKLKDGGLCAMCIFAYIVNFYFFAGFCEEFVKFLVLRRIQHSCLTSDWRALLVYGISTGCGFATAENIMYVFSGGYATAVVRAYMSVPLHCTTGAILALAIAKNRTEVSPAPFWNVIFVPWLVHGSYDFLLTISEQPSTGNYAALSYLGAIGFFLFGLAYARNEAVKMSCTYPEKVNIHGQILCSQPPILGSEGISQWGDSSECVCSCFWCCAGCCPSKERPNDV